MVVWSVGRSAELMNQYYEAGFLLCALFDVPCLLMGRAREDGSDAIDSHYAARQVPTFFFYYTHTHTLTLEYTF